MTSYDFKVTSSGCHYVKVLSTTVGYSLVAMIPDICCHLAYDSRGAWHIVYDMLLSKYKLDSIYIRTMKKLSMIHFKNDLILC